MKKRQILCSFLVVLSLLILPTWSVIAQDSTPPARHGFPGQGGTDPRSNPEAWQPQVDGEEPPEGGFYQDGAWQVEGNGAPSQTEAEAVKASPPDGYGYTWKDIEFNWIPLRYTGTRLPINYPPDSVTIDLPFSFRFYDYSYDKITVTYNGYLTLGDIRGHAEQSKLGNPVEPNNVIAPYWSKYTSSNVYMTTGGDAPDRYVVVQWMAGASLTATSRTRYDFEVLLFENGNIVFQYNGMEYNYAWYCATSGIEDLSATNSLTLYKLCSKTQLPPYRAYLITRPEPAPHMRIYPTEYGKFAAPGQTVTYPVEVLNSGETGADTYTLTTSSKWPLTLTHLDGSPVTDTNADGKLDTGPVEQGEKKTFLVNVTPPASARLGMSNSSRVNATSRLNPKHKISLTFTTTIPASFTQIFAKDDADGRSVFLKFASPGQGDTTRKLDGVTNSPAVLELQNHNIFTAWTENHCSGYDCFSEIRYRIDNPDGEVVRESAPIEDLSEEVGVFDYSAALAQSPDGQIGLVWQQERYDQDTHDYYYNIFYAVLNPEGDIVFAPLNVTNNAHNSPPLLYDPRIAAVGENRFAIAYEMDLQNNDAIWFDNIYLTIRDTAGVEVLPITQVTNDIGDSADKNSIDDSDCYAPALTTLKDGRVLLQWVMSVQKSYTSYGFMVRYRVADSNGQFITPVRSISCGKYYCGEVHAAQTANGQVVLVWDQYNHGYRVYYTILSKSYWMMRSPVGFKPPQAASGSAFPSVTVFNANYAVITWVDANSSFGKHLYYALLGKNGVVVTSPRIFETVGSSQYLSSSYEGYGNSTYTH